MYRTLALLTLLSATAQAEMRPLDDQGLAEVQGAGYGLALENISVNTADFGQPNAGALIFASDAYNLSEIGELRLNKAQSAGGGVGVGANIGTRADPLLISDMRTENGQLVLVFKWPNSADKLDVHFRVDSRRERNYSQLVFDGAYDAKGVKLTDTELRVWAAAVKGLSMALRSDIVIDQLVVQTVNPQLNPTPAQRTAGTLTLTGLTVQNLQLGTDKQPLTSRAFVDGNGRSQLEVAIAPLTSTNKVAPKANISVNAISTGTPIQYDMTGRSSGRFTGNYTALQPIPGRNLINIQGLQIQKLTVTTRDLQ